MKTVDVSALPASQDQGADIIRIESVGGHCRRPGMVSIEDVVAEMRGRGYGQELDRAAGELAQAFVGPGGEDTLRSLRLKNTGMSQSKLAQACDTQQYLISKYENGEVKPDVDTIKKLCAALRVDFNAFFAALAETERSVHDGR